MECFYKEWQLFIICKSLNSAQFFFFTSISETSIAKIYIQVEKTFKSLLYKIYYSISCRGGWQPTHDPSTISPFPPGICIVHKQFLFTGTSVSRCSK